MYPSRVHFLRKLYTVIASYAAFLFVVILITACDSTGTAVNISPTATAQLTTPPAHLPLSSPTSTLSVPTVTTATPDRSGTSTIPVQRPGATPALPTAAIPAPSPTLPFTPQVISLTRANCCSEYHWSADGRVYYYDKPQDGQAGTYIVEAAPNKIPRLLTTQAGLFTPDLSLVTQFGREANERPGFGATVTVRAVNGATVATLSDAGTIFAVSPDKKHYVYARRNEQQEGSERPQIFTLWTGDVAQQTNGRQLGTFREVADLQWLPDNTRILFAGRDLANKRFGVWTVDVKTSGATAVVESKGVRNVQVSPDGLYLLYYVTFQAEAQTNGVWLSSLEGGPPTKLPFVGGYAWSPDSRSIIYVPQPEPNSPRFAIWRYTLSGSKTTRLTDAAKTVLPFIERLQIAPDGKAILFRNGEGAVSVVRFAS